MTDQTTTVNIPLEPPILVRTLSEPHWTAADIEMKSKKHKAQWAGEHDIWYFQCTRATTSSQDVVHRTFRNGEQVDAVITRLPQTRRCTKHMRNGKVCRNRTYGTLCAVHYKEHSR